MGQGPKPAKSKVGAKRSISPKPPKSDGATIRDLEKRLAATAEILRLISSSPADAQPVFDAIAVNALRLCDANGAVVGSVTHDGKTFYNGAGGHIATVEVRVEHGLPYPLVAECSPAGHSNSGRFWRSAWYA